NILNIQQGRLNIYDYWRPANSTIHGSQDRAAFTDCQAPFIIAKVNVKDRRGSSRVLFCPGGSAIHGSKNRTVRARYPATLIVREIDVNELQSARRALTLPGFAGVVSVKQNTVDDVLSPADGTYYPAFLLAGKTHAVEFNISPVKLAWQEAANLTPAHAIVTRRKDGIAGN